MRKFFIFCMMFMVIVSGCSNKRKLEENYSVYKSYIDLVIDNKENVSTNLPFEYEIELYDQEDGTYRYVITIDAPKTAMYDIQMIAIDKTLDGTQMTYPTVGILGDDADSKFHMIPNQVNVDKNYVAGFHLDGISKTNDFRLNVLVVWKDYEGLVTYKAFFNADSPSYSGINSENVGEKEKGSIKAYDTNEDAGREENEAE